MNGFKIQWRPFINGVLQVMAFCLIFFVAVIGECLIRSAYRKPIPVVFEETAQAKVAAFVQPDFFWMGDDWQVKVECNSPVRLDFDGKWQALVPAGMHSIYSNHDSDNTHEFTSERGTQRVAPLAIRVTKP